MSLQITISEHALIFYAQKALAEIRADAEWIKLFSQTTARRSSPEAFNAVRRIAIRRSQEHRPLLKKAIEFFGSEIFRRKTFPAGGVK